MSAKIITALFLVVASFNLVYGLLNGTEVVGPKYPYQAFLKIQNQFQCGAAILSESFVIATASCVRNAHYGLTVVVGTNNPNDNSGNSYPVFERIIFPFYEPNEGILYKHSVNDLALLKIAGKFEFSAKVQPVKLPKVFEGVPDNTTAVLTGYGKEEFGPAYKYPVNLRELNTRIMNHESCEKEWTSKKFVLIRETMLCTIPEYATGACEGDSGSPLVVNGTLVGISSFGFKCGWFLPDIYTKISEYVDWIELQMKPNSPMATIF